MSANKLMYICFMVQFKFVRSLNHFDIFLENLRVRPVVLKSKVTINIIFNLWLFWLILLADIVMEIGFSVLS